MQSRHRRQHRQFLLFNLAMGVLLFFSTTSSAWHQTPMLSRCGTHQQPSLSGYTPEHPGREAGHESHTMPLGIVDNPGHACDSTGCDICSDYVSSHFQALIGGYTLPATQRHPTLNDLSAPPIPQQLQRPPTPPPKTRA